ncbi:MAG TPA: sensor domain-containing diguanylate cyclase [Thermoanaerobaculia bacterium]
MNRLEAGIFSERQDLVGALRESCPGWSFLDTEGSRESCRIAIVDGTEERPAGRSLVRLFLSCGPVEDQRRPGELCVERDVFLADASRFLAFAADLVDAAHHASELEREAAYLRHIHELMTIGDEKAVSEQITTTALSLLGVPFATLFLHDPRQERYVVSYTSEPDLRESLDFLPGIPPALLQQALASETHLAMSRDERGWGMVVMPLQVREDLIGVIRVRLTPEDEIEEGASSNVTKYLEAVTQVLANIYQLTRSRDLAMRDDLTKAYNRRFFETYLDEEIERSRRYGTLFSIIFLDLDDLKMVNNEYGHLCGSRTLQEVAKRILGAVRGIDKVVRFGGDEFCVILPQTDEEQAVAVANRIARAISAAPLKIDETIDVFITASFGIATYPTHAMTKDTLIRQADAAMYRVKSTTKNAVGVATVDDATRPVVGRESLNSGS